jgi:Ca-activated chloride channel family protein
MHMTSSIRLAAISLVSILSMAPRAALAQEERPRADKTLSPYFAVESSDPAVDRLPLKDTRVDIAISGVIADVTVTQLYQNTGQHALHARYVFPASTRAAVYGMTMTIGDTRIVAKIQERVAAKREFEAAKQVGKSASLLEESRPNVFTMNVANVLPGDTIAVELKYTELLVPTDGVYEFMYPTVVGPRYSSKTKSEASDADAFVRTPYLHEGQPTPSGFHLAGQLSTGVPIQEVASTSHQIVVHQAGQGRADFSIADSQIANNRDFILRYRLAGQQIASGLLLYQGAEENFFLLMAQPPRALDAGDILPREYIFVLDVSGSMNGFPLDTAKALMRELAGKGYAILFYSSDLPELVHVADRVAVMRNGEIAAILAGDAISEEAILKAAMFESGQN